MTSTLELQILVGLLGVLVVGGTDATGPEQCWKYDRLHVEFAGLEKPARLLNTEYLLMSASECYDACCQFNTEDETPCNAAVFRPFEQINGEISAGGTCLLLDCRPLFSNCRWTMSPNSLSSVARIVRRNSTQPSDAVPQQQPEQEDASSSPAETSADVSSPATVDDTTSPTPLAAPTTSTGPVEDGGQIQSTTAAAATTADSGSEDTPTGERDESSYYWDGFDYGGDNAGTSSGTEQQQEQQLQQEQEQQQQQEGKTGNSAQINPNDSDDYAFWNLLENNRELSTAPTGTTTIATTPDTEVAADEDDRAGGTQDDAAWNDNVEKIDESESPAPTAWNNPSRGDDGELLPFIFEVRPAEPSVQWFVAVIAGLTTVAVVCLVVVVIGCRRACATGPRYVPLRDDYRTPSGDFPTNYLVSQPSSSNYRASLLPK